MARYVEPKEEKEWKLILFYYFLIEKSPNYSDYMHAIVCGHICGQNFTKVNGLSDVRFLAETMNISGIDRSPHQWLFIKNSKCFAHVSCFSITIAQPLHCLDL